jgi:predicted nuclease of predicted toxin-antitoxin system
MNPSALRFLADESCDYAVVRTLRSAGYDVFAVCDVVRRSDDSELIAQAAREQRILLTENKDFGWLVFVSHADSSGVILIRFPGNARQSLGPLIKRVVQEYGRELIGCFTVVQPGQVRISRGPHAG